MSFSPALATRQVVVLPQSKSATLYFTYSAPDSQDVNNQSVPEVWTNLPARQWQAIPFERRQSSDLWVANVESDNGGTFEYTFRINHGNDNVQWLGSQGSNGTIELVDAPLSTPSLSTSSCPFSFDKGVKITAETEGAIVASFELSQGKSGDVQSFKLKRDADDLEHANGLVLERTERTWITPRQLFGHECVTGLSHEYDASLLYIRASPSSVQPSPQSVIVFPVSTTLVCSSLRGGDSSVWLRCTRDTPADDVSGQVIVAWGSSDDEFSTLMQRCISLARNVIKSQDSFWQQLETRYPPVEPTQELQGLTVCTWNALNYDHYTESDVETWLTGLFDKHKTSSLFSHAIETVLLDDGWQDVDHFLDTVDGSKNRRAVNSFEARQEWLGSSSGLKEAIGKIKAKGVKRVGVWMTLEGYWDGLSPNGPLAQKYDLGLWQVDTVLPKFAEGDTHWYFPKLDDVYNYYHDYFTGLRRAGVDFVKVDDQAHQDYLVEPRDADKQTDSGLIRQEMLKRMRQASNEVFGTGTTINCMAHSPRIWNGALGIIRTGQRSLMRNSDDYFPDRPGSHPWHLFVNAYNTWLTSELALVPDFDMCQERTTSGDEPHPFGTYHIAFRAFSPAPTFSTDVPNGPFQDSKGWQALLAKTKFDVDSRSNKRETTCKLVKTTTTSGKALENRLGEDVLGSGQGQPLRVGLTLDQARGGHIGVWNTRREGGKAKGCIDVLDVRDVVKPLGDEHASYVVALEGQTAVVDPASLATTLSRLVAQPLVHVSLDEREFKIATIARVERLPVKTVDGDGNVEIACLGLMDKHTGLAVVSSVEIVTVKETLSELDSPRLPSSPPPSYSSLTRQPGSSLTTSSFPKPHPQSRLALFVYSLVNPSHSSSLAPPQPRSTLSSLSTDLVQRPLSTIWFETRTLISFTLAVIMWSWTRVHGSLKKRVGTGADGDNHSRRATRSIESGPSTPLLKDKVSFGDDKVSSSTRQDVVETHSQSLQVQLQAVSKEFGLWIKPRSSMTVRELLKNLHVTLDGHVVSRKHVSVSFDGGKRRVTLDEADRDREEREAVIVVDLESVADEVGYERGDGEAFWTCQVSFQA
ncbi:hypothetical protein ACM66B_002437 [Microbotryomycetes sp. NB124-2]